MNLFSKPAKSENDTAPTSSAKALPILATVFFMWGFITALNDILAPHLKSVFELTYTKTMLIQFVFFGAYFLMSLPAAKLLERIGYKHAIVLGLLTASVGALAFVPAATFACYAAFLGGLFILATGITILQVAANPYVALLGSVHTASSRLNLVQALNSFGTTAAPVFGGLLILSKTLSGTAQGGIVALSLEQRMQDALAVRIPYIGIALLLIVLAGLIFIRRLPALSMQHGNAGNSAESVWRHSRLVFGLGAIFFYVGAEVSIGAFLINYLSSPRVVNMSHANAAFYVGLFWGGAMVGRVIGAGVMRRISPAIVLGSAAIGACGLVTVSIAANGWLALWAIVLVGLTNSIMFPTIFTLAIEGLGALTARGSALLIMAIIGGAIVPMVQGFLADTIGLRLAFITPILCYLYVLFFAFHCHGTKPGAPPPQAHETQLV